MSLHQKVIKILQKLNIPDCFLAAEKEFKSLVINEIDDGEKLVILINCIGDDRDLQGIKNKKLKQYQLKLFIIIAEVFQHQILEYLPRMFNTLKSKMKEADLDLSEIISDTYGGVLEFAFKGAEELECEQILIDCFKSILESFEKTSKPTQIAAGMSLIKLLQNCPIEILNEKFNNLYDLISNVLNSSQVKSSFHLFECVLSLVLNVQEKVGSILGTLPTILLKYASDEEFKTRKTCIDIFYSIWVIDRTLLKAHENQVYEMLQNAKSDRNKSVREAAVECLKIIKPHVGSLTSSKTEDKQSISSVQSLRNIEADKKNDNIKKMKESNVSKDDKKPLAKVKMPFVNKKVDVTNVQSLIDKNVMNQDFLKNLDTGEETVILFKEPRIKIDYEKFMNEPALVHGTNIKRDPNFVKKQIPKNAEDANDKKKNNQEEERKRNSEEDRKKYSEDNKKKQTDNVNKRDIENDKRQRNEQNRKKQHNENSFEEIDSNKNNQHQVEERNDSQTNFRNSGIEIRMPKNSKKNTKYVAEFEQKKTDLYLSDEDQNFRDEEIKINKNGTDVVDKQFQNVFPPVQLNESIKHARNFVRERATESLEKVEASMREISKGNKFETDSLFETKINPFDVPEKHEHNPMYRNPNPNQQQNSAIPDLVMNVQFLNVRVSELESVVLNLQNNNALLTTKLLSMEKNLMSMSMLLNKQSGNDMGGNQMGGFQGLGFPPSYQGYGIQGSNKNIMQGNQLDRRYNDQQFYKNYQNY